MPLTYLNGLFSNSNSTQLMKNQRTFLYVTLIGIMLLTAVSCKKKTNDPDDEEESTYTVLIADTVTCGYRESAMIRPDGRALGFGVLATLFNNSTQFKQIVEGATCVYGLKHDGTVMASGSNMNGQLGDSSLIDHFIFTQVHDLTNIVEISAGISHCLALRSDGTVWAWGNNEMGQVGDTTVDFFWEPVQIQGLSNVTDLAAGYLHNIVLKNDGTVWCWGNNAYGSSGQPPATSILVVPMQVAGLSDIKLIAGGSLHSMAVTQSGELYTWGSDGSDALGFYAGTHSETPVLQSQMGIVTAIAAGEAYALAVRDDGKIISWGSNIYGQTGIGGTSYSSSPTVLNNVSKDIRQVAAGRDFSFAIATDGSVYAWGNNANGVLGPNFTFGNYYTSPILVEDN